MIPNAITALALCMGLTGVSLAIRGEWERALGGDRPRRRPRRARRAHRAAAARAEQVRGRARFAERQYRVRHRAGADPVPVVAADRAAVRLDRGAGARGLLRAAAGAVQRPDRRRRAAAQVGRLQHRRSGAGGRGAGLHPDLSVADHRQRPCSSAWQLVMAVDPVHRRADDLQPADLQLVEHPHPAARGGCSRWPGSRCSARR